MNVLIGGAWPYANGSLHIGHLSSLLGGDILARYFRLKGASVCYVSGSDCHGTPITIRAKKDGVNPGEITEHYHQEFDDSFRRLGFTYDGYGRTDSDYHKDFTRSFLKTLYKKGNLYEKQIEQAFCDRCNQFLPDRFVVGKCPHCGKDAKGDQCDHCGSLLDPVQLEERKCGICGSSPEFKPSCHLFLPLSKYEADVRRLLEEAKGWRSNAIGLTKRYLDEGLKDRAATRDIDWGVSVPIEGYEDKKIYVWVEAVLGYLSTAQKWCEETDRSFEDFWSDEEEDLVHYYIHGKDNIPFHSVILPALLLAHGNLKLPDRIISSEYETLEGKKISTSSNWAIWVPYLIENYHPDSIRYFFISNGPERKDSDFSWNEFYNSHNADLVGQFGNLANRTLVFLKKSFDNKVPNGLIDPEIEAEILKTYENSGSLIEQGSFREALQTVFSLVRFANKYFDDKKPWQTYKEDLSSCEESLYNCVQIIANLAVLLEPFVPFSCVALREILNLHVTVWSKVELNPSHGLNEPRILFERLDKKRAADELNKLRGCLNQ